METVGCYGCIIIIKGEWGGLIIKRRHHDGVLSNDFVFQGSRREEGACCYIVVYNFKPISES